MSRRALLHGLGLPVLTALVLTSCGDGGNDLRAARTTGSPAAEDAVAADVDVAEGAAQVDCPLTAEQVAAVLGTRMAQRESGCAFEAADGSFAEVYYSAVSVDVFAADEPTAVDGVGDEAYLGPSDELYVLAGDRAFSLHVLASPSDSAIDGAAAQVELARLVVDSA